MSNAASVIKAAKSEVGYREGRSSGRWNNQNKFAKEAGHANGYAWCATFVCAMFKRAGLSGLITTPSAGVDQLSVGFKRAKRWSEYPAIGAVIFFGKPTDLNHTGIVYNYDSTYVYTIEGNTNGNGSREGDGVYLKKRLRRDRNVVGYGYPAFAEGIKSADPAWAKATPKPQTRGPLIDSAIGTLKKAKPSTRNAPKVKAALDALRSIKTWNK